VNKNGALKAGRYWFVSVVGVFALLLLLPGCQTARATDSHSQYLVYVGTRGKHDVGIYGYRFNEDTEKLTSLGFEAETADPFSLVASRDGRSLYAANIISNFKDQGTGSVSAFAIDRQTGKLTLVDQVSSGGAGPAYVSMDRTGRFLLVANYMGGSVAVLPVREDGSPGKVTGFVQHSGSSEDPKRQASPHPHAFNVSPDNRFALAADLGLDKLLVYQFNSTTGSLSRAETPYASVKRGSGPRHFVFSPNGKFVYVVNEMGSTISLFSYDARSATLHDLQMISTLPEGFAGENTGAEVAVDRSGKFLYASNRGNDTIAVFAISPRKGTLTPIEYAPVQGKIPGMFAFDPSGDYLFVANQGSDNVVVLRVNQKTGRLTPTGQAVNLPGPVSLAFVAVQ
jgi:6-phosphogluconolactonase